MKNGLLIILVLLCFTLVSCKKEVIEADELVPYEPHLPESPYNYTAINFPASFSIPPLSFLNSIQDDNQITNDGATLGRVLFYDRNLSKNGRVSCASCHKQELAFSDGVPFSKGLYNQLTGRNSMAIMNTKFSFRFFWDQRSLYLENQVKEPIKNHVEMDMDLDFLVTKLQGLAYYPDLFQKAFGSSEISVDRISKALSQFLHSLVSYNSKYDEGVATDYANFSQLEKDGKDLFMSGAVNCNNCHSTANFFNNQPLVNGLDSNYTDKGMILITGDPLDDGRFKTPTLRNIEVTGPYMHDGRFTTLEQVIEHYNSGIQAHPNLDDRLTLEGHTGGTPKKYNMTEYQKQSLVAFLKTLTDPTFLTDVKFSDPFK